MLLRTWIALTCLWLPAFSQDSSRTPEDLATDLYRLVSGPAGQERDWDAFRGLFEPDALFRFVAEDGSVFSMNVEGYVRNYGPSFLKRGVREEEIGGVTRVFGRLAHRWSAYRYRWLDKNDDKGRGAAGIQMVKGTEGWRIASLTYHLETPGSALPTEWLGEEK